jgi:hypothetical protein
MPQTGRKPTNEILLLLRLMKKTYLPGKFRKVYAIAMVWGGCIGGFFGGIAAVSYHTMAWVIALSTCMGIVLGAVVALGLVPKK